MSNSPGAIRRLFSALWGGLDATRRFVINLLFLLIVIAVLVAVFAPSKNIVPRGAALIIAPAGEVVEQLDYVDPMAALLGAENSKPPQTLLKDLLDAIKNAKDDARIKALVLLPADMSYASTTQLASLRAAVLDFKKSGKKVYAMADYYTQQGYYLASLADEVYMSPYGGIDIEGYSRFRMYFKSALDKLGINFHVFRVGAYKSAVEPYLRDDMSAEDRESSQAFLGVLWDEYKKAVAEDRKLKPEAIENYVTGFVDNLKASGGDTAKLALDAKLIDGFKTRDQWRDYMISLVGKDREEKTYKNIGFKTYLNIIRPPVDLPHPDHDKVAIIVAKGEILDGEQPAGSIGGDTLAQLIRQAREDKTVKALVLRVDSPGGSAFASEVIRRELEVTQKAGKPVVVSMGTYAASGGYWISATADEIIAQPTTVTGSIGIFGMIPTFEQPLNNWGIHSDGVGTTPLAGALDLTRPLKPEVGELIQQSINHGYDRFINLVAQGRKKTPEQIHAIAQGRVWIGSKALELGLVDKLGDLDDAVKAAATRAKLTDYDVRYFEKELTAREQFLRNLTTNAMAWMGIDKTTLVKAQGPAAEFMYSLKSQVEQAFRLNDPNHAYVHCLCEVR